ncbi:hypothetical protein [Saccharopolyspora sp. 5N708]|uniref:hypothetical protein n=1 Tax=Saccharopolyspora sp. 5N708 TaxID=3457424 RepID=UPI003FD1FB30
MSLIKCEICRGYYDDSEGDLGHRCNGLRSVDWAHFLRSLRHWMTTDKNALFEAYYARRNRAGKQDDQPSA